MKEEEMEGERKVEEGRMQGGSEGESRGSNGGREKEELQQ